MKHLIQWFRRRKARRRQRDPWHHGRLRQRKEFDSLPPEWQRLIAALGYAPPPEDKREDR